MSGKLQRGSVWFNSSLLETSWPSVIYSPLSFFSADLILFLNIGRLSRQHDIYYLPSRSQEDVGNQTAVPGDDHKELEKILHLRSYGKIWPQPSQLAPILAFPSVLLADISAFVRKGCRDQFLSLLTLVGPGRQECSEAFSRVQLSVHDQSETVHLHDAYETWRWLESDPGRKGPRIFSDFRIILLMTDVAMGKYEQKRRVNWSIWRVYVAVFLHYDTDFKQNR